MSKISAVINTYNASELLEQTLISLKGFDEIVVCDMESSDNTIEIAEQFGCKIVIFPKGDYNICEPARNTAIQSASNDWVLIVDADETVTPQLVKYLYERISEEDCPEAIMIPRRNKMLDGFDESDYPDYQCRFVKKDKVEWPAIIHAKPIIDGKIERIPAKRKELALIHAPEKMSSYFLKVCRYTDNEVEKRASKHVTLAKLMFEPFFRFFKIYVMKGGFLQGKVGYIRAQRFCFYRFIVLCKIYEREIQLKK